MPAAGGLDGFDEELASSILLDDGDGAPAAHFGAGPRMYASGYYVGDQALAAAASSQGGPRPHGRPGSSPKGGSGHHSGSSQRHSRHLQAPHQRADGEAPNRTPTRTPSPVGVYHWSHGKGEEGEAPPPGSSGRHGGGGPLGKSSSSTSSGADPQGFGGQMPYSPTFPSFWPGAFNPHMQEAYYGMLMNNPGAMAAAAAGGGFPRGGADSDGPGEGGSAAAGSSTAVDPAMWQMMMAMQANGATGAAASADVAQGLSSSSASAALAGVAAADHGAAAASWLGEGKRTKSRMKAFSVSQEKDMAALRPVSEVASMALAQPRERGQGGGGQGGGGGAKNDKRRRGGAGGGVGAAGGEERPGGGQGGGGGGKSRPASNPIVEQLKARERNVELGDLAAHIAEIAQDQYGSRLIQQKLEVASDEEKQLAFKSVLQKMPQLTQDVFGNYVIQKFFEHGTPEQRRILAEQLVGQVLQLSLQMYGCRVVQKALDWVPIEQQVLLIGELKGHVLQCIEDQHGNHVIQKCIERLPTDRIGFIVDSFRDQACRMAKHCYGCRVIQRLIEFCASHQISPLLDEVLCSCMELATDQYGNYVVQHVMEHSSRPGDRQAIMHRVRENILSLSCHKYASNVIEKALTCGTMEERSLLIYAIIGEPGHARPPLLTMMGDRFGNYIVQRVIALAAGPQRDALLWKLHEHMPTLKKSNPYGKHIVSALERAEGNS